MRPQRYGQSESGIFFFKNMEYLDLSNSAVLVGSRWVAWWSLATNCLLITEDSLGLSSGENHCPFALCLASFLFALLVSLCIGWILAFQVCVE